MEQQTTIPEVKYNHPGVSRELSTAKLTSGLPYQRPVNPEDVDRLIAKWNPCLLTPMDAVYDLLQHTNQDASVPYYQLYRSVSTSMKAMSSSSLL